MNRVLSIAAVLLSAVALGVVLFGSEAPPAAPPPPERWEPPRPAAPEADQGERDAKLAALEWTVSNLVRRVTALEKSVEARPAEASAVTAGERQQLQALRGDVDALLTGEVLDTETGQARLKELVGKVQDELFAERVQQRQAARESRQAERLQRFVEEARLSPTQGEDLKRLLEAESQERRRLFEELRAGQPGGGRPDFSGLRAVRERTDEQARALLDEEQQKQFEAMRQEDRRGGRGGEGGRGGRQRGR